MKRISAQKIWWNGQCSAFIHALQIPNSLGDKFSQWDSQNETLITHYEKKNRDHAKYFLFWENQVSLRIDLMEL